MEDAWINSVIFTAIFLKESGGHPIVNPGDLEIGELEFVMEFLIKKKREKQFRAFWTGWEHGVKLITSGEVFVMTGWEPIVYAAQKQNVNAKYAVPKEGYEGWSNDLLLHTGAQQRGLVEAAHRFADWELSGFYGCELRKQRGYVVPSDLNSRYATEHADEFNAGEQKDIEAGVLAKFETMKGKTYWQNVRPRNYVKYEEWWSRLRSA